MKRQQIHPCPSIQQRMNKLSEEKLIQLCIKGNPAAQEELFGRYYGPMMQICRRYTSGSEEAKDLLQEGFIKIFENLQRFKGNSSLKTWMSRIMVNMAIDHFHKGKRLNESDLSDNLNETQPEEETDENPLMMLNPEDVLTLLQKLPVGYRTVINLYAIEGYSHKQIAEKLGITEGTSRSQLAKGRSLLLEMVKPMLTKLMV